MTNTPHDAVFKAVFEQPEHAAAELQHVLSADLVAAIDWSSLALEPGSFVDEELADQHSDLLFSASAKGSGESVLVYLLFEHLCGAPHKCSYAARVVMRRGSRRPEQFSAGRSDLERITSRLTTPPDATPEVYLEVDPLRKLRAIAGAVPPSLRPGKFRPSDRLLAPPQAGFGYAEHMTADAGLHRDGQHLSEPRRITTRAA